MWRYLWELFLYVVNQKRTFINKLKTQSKSSQGAITWFGMGQQTTKLKRSIDSSMNVKQTKITKEWGRGEKGGGGGGGEESTMADFHMPLTWKHPLTLNNLSRLQFSAKQVSSSSSTPFIAANLSSSRLEQLATASWITSTQNCQQSNNKNRTSMDDIHTQLPTVKQQNPYFNG